MRRRLLAGVTLLATVSVIAGACTAPTAKTWKVKASRIEVVQQEDWDPGDEPYAIQVGFRSKFGVENSSSASTASQCTSGTVPGNDAHPSGSTYDIPAGAADIVFPQVQNLDIGDILAKTAPLELFGTITFLAERDAVLPGCALTDAFSSLLAANLPVALDTLLGDLSVPPTQEQLIDLIVTAVGNVLNSVGALIGTVIEGLGNPDDIIGAVIQIHMPSAGGLRDLIDFGLTLAGFDNGVLEIEGLGENTKIRVGHLLPSSATFDIVNPGIAHYRYTSVVGG